MSHVSEVIAAERDAVAAFLRRVAKDYMKHADSLRADTMQSDPEARQEERAATALETAAAWIVKGAHWR